MAAKRPPRLVRRGSKKLKNLRTYVVANGKDIMGSTQGYNDPRERADAEELALRALFTDPALQHVAFQLAEDLVLASLYEKFQGLIHPRERVQKKVDATGKPNK